MKPARLILGCRNQAKGEAAAIKEETVYTTSEVWLIDLLSFASVSAFVDKFEKDGGRLDILVANAGILGDKYEPTEDGWEPALQTNILSTSLFCLLLAPRMVETAKKHNTKPRITIVASTGHHYVDFNQKVYEAESSFQYLSTKEYCTPQRLQQMRYFETKLLNIFFMHSLAELLAPTPIIVNAVCPGLAYSDLGRDLTGFAAFLDWLLRALLAWTTEESGRQLVYAAVGVSGSGRGDRGDEGAERLRGAYLDLTEVTEPSHHVLGEDGKRRRDKLWNDLVRELSKVDARVPEIVQKFKYQTI